MHLIKTVIFVTLFALTGCSFVKGFVLSNLDWFLMKELNQRFDLTDEQYEIFEKKARIHLAWFQKEPIDLIIKELEFIRKQEKPLPPEIIEELTVLKPRQLWLSIVSQIRHDGAQLFKSLSNEQFNTFKEQLSQRIEKRQELLEGKPEEFPEKYQDFQEERLDKLSEWLGEFNESQAQSYYKLTKMSREEYLSQTEILRTLNEEFLREVRSLSPKGDLAKFLVDWATQPKIKGSPAYQKQRWERRVKLWVHLEETLTKEQREFRRKKLGVLIQDLKGIRIAQF